MHTALTIAGSDSSGGAGIQADLKTFAALGVYGMSAITAITAQNTCGVQAVRALDQEIVEAQLDSVFSDITVDAVKIGMLADAAITRSVAKRLRQYEAAHVVVDPVMISKHGHPLLQETAVQELIHSLLPLAEVLTPNLPEAEALVGYAVYDPDSMLRAAQDLLRLGPRVVVVKGGHLTGSACDLYYDGTQKVYLETERIDTIHTHGTGCTFSAAIAAGLAKGLKTLQAVREAKAFITQAISQSFPLGKGIGPTHHFHAYYSGRND